MNIEWTAVEGLGCFHRICDYCRTPLFEFSTLGKKGEYCSKACKETIEGVYTNNKRKQKRTRVPKPPPPVCANCGENIQEFSFRGGQDGSLRFCSSDCRGPVNTPQYEPRKRKSQRQRERFGFDDQSKLVLLVQENPYRGRRAERFEVARECRTVGQFCKKAGEAGLGSSRTFLRRGIAAGHLRIGEEETNNV